METTADSERDLDWDYFYELAVLFDQYKAKELVALNRCGSSFTETTAPVTDDDEADENDDENDEGEAPPTTRHLAGYEDVSARLEGMLGAKCVYTVKCDWLDHDWISTYLVEDDSRGNLSFEFHDSMLFRRFDHMDKANRDSVIVKFVDTLLSHPRSSELTCLNLSHCLLPDKFLEVLSARILESPQRSALPQIQVLNVESNALKGPGVKALANVLRDESAWKYLQVLLLENQPKPFTLNSEAALAEAVGDNDALVVCSYSVKGDAQRIRIHNRLLRNIDVLRRARRVRASREGTLRERPRNEMERFFDDVRDDDPSVDDVDLVGDQKFIALPKVEKTKAGTALANNTRVTTVRMVRLGLDDDFCRALGESLKTNTTVTTILLDSNAITGEGLIALFRGLADNTTVTELQIRHQTKTMSSTDEAALPALLQRNTSILKLGVDLRNKHVQTLVGRLVHGNRERQRKEVVNQRLLEMQQSKEESSSSSTQSQNKWKRNKTELFFDRVAANDANIDTVHFVEDARVATLNSDQKAHLGASFACNTHVKTIKMVKVGLDDAFAKALGKALETNSTIEKIVLDSNAISGVGLQALFSGITKNSSVQEMQLRHQTKTMATAEEVTLPSFMETNTTLIKLGVDLRNQAIRLKLESITSANWDKQRKLKMIKMKSLSRVEQSSKKRDDGPTQDDATNNALSSPPRKRKKLDVFFEKIANNDPNIDKVVIENNPIDLDDTIWAKAGTSFAANTHVRTIKMIKTRINDAFAKALAISLETNSCLEQIILDCNSLSGTGIKALFAGLAKNKSVTELQVKDQMKTMSSAEENELFDILKSNTSLLKLGVDVRSQSIKMQLEQMLRTNHELKRKLQIKTKKETKREANKLITIDTTVHENEAKRHISINTDLTSGVNNGKSEKINVLQQSTSTKTSTSSKFNDMMFFFEDVAKNREDIKKIKFCANPKFAPSPKSKTGVELVYKTHIKSLRSLNDTQWAKVGAAFASNDRVKSIKMVGVLANDEFAKALGKSLETNSRLEKIVLNDNNISGIGIKALFAGLANNKSVRKLEIQRQASTMSSEDENELFSLIESNTFLVKLSLDIRSQSIETQFNRMLTKNEELREARKAELKKGSGERMNDHPDETRVGTMTSAKKSPMSIFKQDNINMVDVTKSFRQSLAKFNTDDSNSAAPSDVQRRKYNEMYSLFEAVANNIPSITTVDFCNNPKIMFNQKAKAGTAFAHNSHVNSLKMINMDLDDQFVIALGKSLETNTSLNKIILDGNNISGKGIKALFAGLARNKSVRELQVRRQSKTMSSKEESELFSVLQSNTSLLKLGVDVRTSVVKMQLERLASTNREVERKFNRRMKQQVMTKTDNHPEKCGNSNTNEGSRNLLSERQDKSAQNIDEPLSITRANNAPPDVSFQQNVFDGCQKVSAQKTDGQPSSEVNNAPCNINRRSSHYECHQNSAYKSDLRPKNDSLRSAHKTYTRAKSKSLRVDVKHSSTQDKNSTPKITNQYKKDAVKKASSPRRYNLWKTQRTEKTCISSFHDCSVDTLVPINLFRTRCRRN